jgi:hypothetical protein
VDRDFTPSPGAAEAAIFEDFDKKTGKNTSGNANIASQITIKHDKIAPWHMQRGAAITWQSASPSTFFETVWAAAGKGRDIQNYATLDIRIARQDNDSLNKDSTTDFSVALEDATGRFSSSIPVSKYAVINGPANPNRVLKSVRIPVAAFSGVDLKKIHGLRFTFDKTDSGAIYLANIRLHRHAGIGSDLPTGTPDMQNRNISLKTAAQNVMSIVPENLNSIHVAHGFGRDISKVEIRMASHVPFTVMDSLPVLKIGDKEFRLSRYSDTRYLKELTFTLTADEYAHVMKNAEVTVRNGKIWKFKSLSSVK